jgi:hypothetical protein
VKKPFLGNFKNTKAEEIFHKLLLFFKKCPFEFLGPSVGYISSSYEIPRTIFGSTHNWYVIPSKIV